MTEPPPTKRPRTDDATSSTPATSSSDSSTKPYRKPKEVSQTAPPDRIVDRRLFHVPPPSDTDADVGIREFIDKSTPGFSGIFKARFTDFIVHELTPDGTRVELTEVNIPPELQLKRPGDATSVEVGAPMPTPSSDSTATQEAQGLAVLASGLPEESRDQVISDFWTFIASEAPRTESKAFFAFPGSSDKPARTAQHQAVKTYFPFLVTDSGIGENDLRFVRVHFRSATRGLRSERRVDPRREKYDNGRSSRRRKDDNREALMFDAREQATWPTGPNTHLEFVMYKENTDTQAALGRLIDLSHAPKDAFTIAGTKDKRAVTTQRVRAQRMNPVKLVSMSKLSRGSIQTGNYSFAQGPLRLGELGGNEFEIVLRNVVGATQETVDSAMASLRDHGFINYFGSQRFGTGGTASHHLGALMLRQEWDNAVSYLLSPRVGGIDPKRDEMIARRHWADTRGEEPYKTMGLFPSRCNTERAVAQGLARFGTRNALDALKRMPRMMMKLYYHAYQSYLFNIAASERIARHGLTPIIGDLVLETGCTLWESKAFEEDEEAVDEEAASGGGDVKMDDADDETSTATTTTATNPNGGQVIAAVRVLKTAEDVAAARMDQVVLPLVGHSSVMPENDIAQVFKDLLAQDKIEHRHFFGEGTRMKLSGGYRHLIARPRGVSWSMMNYADHTQDLSETDVVRLARIEAGNTEPAVMGNEGGEFTAVKMVFQLPPSTYATMALREVMKTSMAPGVQREMNPTELRSREEQEAASKKDQGAPTN